MEIGTQIKKYRNHMDIQSALMLSSVFNISLDQLILSSRFQLSLLPKRTRRHQHPHEEREQGDNDPVQNDQGNCFCFSQQRIK